MACGLSRWREDFLYAAHAKNGYGNLMLTPEQQQMFVQDCRMFSFHGRRLGRNGATHCVLANASKDVLEGALRVAYKRRVKETRRRRDQRAQSGKRNQLQTTLQKWLD